MQDSEGAFKQKPIRTLALFVILVLAIVGFLVSVSDTISADRKLPPSTATTHDRALRGKIISADGYTLGRSSKKYQATIFTQSINPDKKDLLIKLFAIYSSNDEKTLRKIIKKSKGYTVLAEDIDASTAIRLKSLAYKLRRLRVFKSVRNSQGVDILYGLDIIENGEERSFPLKDTLSPVLGYVRNKDDGKYTEVKGVKGLERSYEKYLNSNNNGFVKGMRDVSSTIIRNKNSIVKVRKDGMDVHLNIPLTLQRRVELVLDEMKKLIKAKEIIAGVMDSRTGKVIALASSERYDPDNIRKKDVYSLNPKFSEFLYEPGSTMKPITMSIAMEAGKVTPAKWFDTNNGRLKLSKRFTIKDDHPEESMTAEDIIIHSSNIGITKIAWMLSPKILYKGYKKFGFGLATGIDLSRELVGKVRSQKELKSTINKASQAYGYGMMASFAQLWKAYSAFDNHGIAVTPRITAYLQDKSAKKYLSRPTVGDMRTVSKKTANQMKKILIKVVTDGTGKAAIYPGLTIGGKTGTSHIVEKRRYIDKYNSSFFGFVNDDKGSRYTIGVLVMRLHKGHKHFASQSAVPTFKKIVTNMIELEYLKPDLSVIQKQEMEAQEKKRQKIAQQKQQQRTREIKAKLKRERQEIKRKQKAQRLKEKRNATQKRKVNSQQSTPRSKPKRRPTPQEAVPDLF
ncbi:MAG: penicillin-binding protein 2 [Sulfurovum sp.]|nr:penicillin-binding protein 2 [Sulfurovum sp.]